MTKIRTLTRSFLQEHPMQGDPTQFVESFLNSLYVDYKSENYLNKLFQLNNRNIKRKKIKANDLIQIHASLTHSNYFKGHTIRGGKHFTALEKISIRCWQDKAYLSPQIILWDDIPVKQVWDFERIEEAVEGELNTEEFFINGKKIKTIAELEQLANNDGLLLRHFHWWFNKPITGQVICWSDEINY